MRNPLNCIVGKLHIEHFLNLAFFNFGIFWVWRFLSLAFFEYSIFEYGVLWVWRFLSMAFFGFGVFWVWRNLSRAFKLCNSIQFYCNIVITFMILSINLGLQKNIAPLTNFEVFDSLLYTNSLYSLLEWVPDNIKI